MKKARTQVALIRHYGLVPTRSKNCDSDRSILTLKVMLTLVEVISMTSHPQPVTRRWSVLVASMQGETKMSARKSWLVKAARSTATRLMANQKSHHSIHNRRSNFKTILQPKVRPSIQSLAIDAKDQLWTTLWRCRSIRTSQWYKTQVKATSDYKNKEWDEQNDFNSKQNINMSEVTWGFGVLGFCRLFSN